MSLSVVSLVLIAWGLGAEFILVSGGVSVNDIKALKQGMSSRPGERVISLLLKHRLLAAWLGGVVLLAWTLLR